MYPIDCDTQVQRFQEITTPYSILSIQKAIAFAHKNSPTYIDINTISLFPIVISKKAPIAVSPAYTAALKENPYFICINYKMNLNLNNPLQKVT